MLPVQLNYLLTTSLLYIMCLYFMPVCFVVPTVLPVHVTVLPVFLTVLPVYPYSLQLIMAAEAEAESIRVSPTSVSHLYLICT